MIAISRGRGNKKNLSLTVIILSGIILTPIFIVIYLSSSLNDSTIGVYDSKIVNTAGNDGLGKTGQNLDSFDERSHSPSHLLMYSVSSSPRSCSDSATNEMESFFDGTILTENIPLNISVILDPNRISFSWQLCFAKHEHQHILKLRVESVQQSESDQSSSDCDLYLSAHSPHPNRSSWDWKVDKAGPDSIKLFSYAAEFQAAKLDSLFFTVTEKSLQAASSIGDAHHHHCRLTVEVSTMSDHEFLSKVGPLRGRILLPRYLLSKLAATVFISGFIALEFYVCCLLQLTRNNTHFRRNLNTFTLLHYSA
jgi:hypothetical protein